MPLIKIYDVCLMRLFGFRFNLRCGAGDGLCSHQVQNSLQRDFEPGGTVVELVAELVNGFAEEEDIHQQLDIFVFAWKKGGVFGGGEVRFVKDGRNVTGPILCPAGEGFSLRERNTAAFDLLEHGGLGGVVEGANHTGNVAERRAFEAAFADGERGLAFEIDDPKILAVVEDLAEVVITMLARAEGINTALINGAEAF